MMQNLGKVSGKVFGRIRVKNKIKQLRFSFDLLHFSFIWCCICFFCFFVFPLLFYRDLFLYIQMLYGIQGGFHNLFFDCFEAFLGYRGRASNQFFCITHIVIIIFGWLVKVKGKRSF